MKSLLHILLFVASLLFASTMLRDLEVLPFWGWSAQKIEVMRSHGEDYDTVFLGSSRLQYAAMPEVFDSRSGELGRPTSSYSLCFSGTRMLDNVRILDWLIVNKPRNLNRVIVELHTTSQEIRETQWMTDQEIQMHAPCVFLDRMDAILFADKPIWSRCQEAGYCVIHTIMSQLCIGQGARIVQDHVDLANGGRLSRVWDVPDRGWVSIDATAMDHMKRFHEEFSTDRRPYEAVAGEKAVDPSPQWLHGGSRVGPILDIIRRLRDAGIEPVFVVMPSLVWDFQGRDIVNQVRKFARVLELDRASEHRPMFDLASFYDTSHLDAEAARVFSCFLAERLVECKELPLDQDPPARRMPGSGIRFAAKRAPGGAARIEFTADELPFVGQVVVVASHRRQETPLPGGVVLEIPWPPAFQQPLRRDSIYRASGVAEWAGLSADQPLFLQLGVLEGADVVGVSGVVELPPLR